MAIDHRELLRKYMDHVAECEGVTFVEDGRKRSEQFSEEEWAELQEIDRSIWL